MLLFLKVTLIFVFLNRLVIFLTCGEECVKVAHFVSCMEAVGGCGWLSFFCILLLSFVRRWISIQDTKWATFSHSPPHVRKITNLFKNTNIKVTFKNNNTIAQLTKPPTTTIPSPNPHDMSGIYALTCNTCKHAYVGQTSHPSEYDTRNTHVT